MNDLREKLAELEHDRWARWQKHLHSKCDVSTDGSLIIPAGYVEHLNRQIETPYADLSDSEQDSDGREADNTLAVLADHYADLAARPPSQES